MYQCMALVLFFLCLSPQRVQVPNDALALVSDCFLSQLKCRMFPFSSSVSSSCLRYFHRKHLPLMVQQHCSNCLHPNLLL